MSTQVQFTKYSKKRSALQTGILKSYKYMVKVIAVNRMNATNDRLCQILPENLMTDGLSTPPLAFLLTLCWMLENWYGIELKKEF
jgi:hypothetical protein